MKGVPANPDAKLPKWQYVARQLWWVMFYYAQSVGALTVLGFGYALREQAGLNERAKSIFANAVVSWSGAVWVWDRLNCAYSFAAALGVATGITGTWEWPPLMGSLKHAWSVRQMWRYVYSKSGEVCV